MMDYICNDVIFIDHLEAFTELQEILSTDDRVVSFYFNSTPDVGKYTLDVKLKKFQSFCASSLFCDCVMFLQHSNFTYYTRTTSKSNKSVFELVTATDNLTGFYCVVTLH